MAASDADRHPSRRRSSHLDSSDGRSSSSRIYPPSATLSDPDPHHPTPPDPNPHLSSPIYPFPFLSVPCATAKTLTPAADLLFPSSPMATRRPPLRPHPSDSLPSLAPSKDPPQPPLLSAAVRPLSLGHPNPNSNGSDPTRFGSGPELPSFPLFFSSLLTTSQPLFSFPSRPPRFQPDPKQKKKKKTEEKRKKKRTEG